MPTAAQSTSETDPRTPRSSDPIEQEQGAGRHDTAEFHAHGRSPFRVQCRGWPDSTPNPRPVPSLSRRSAVSGPSGALPAMIALVDLGDRPHPCMITACGTPRASGGSSGVHPGRTARSGLRPRSHPSPSGIIDHSLNRDQDDLFRVNPSIVSAQNREPGSSPFDDVGPDDDGIVSEWTPMHRCG